MSAFLWPGNEPRIHAIITEISRPFDCGKFVEIRMMINNRSEVHGEITLRIPAEQARHYRIGNVYAAHFKLVSESNSKIGVGYVADC